MKNTKPKYTGGKLPLLIVVLLYRIKLFFAANANLVTYLVLYRIIPIITSKKNYTK